MKTMTSDKALRDAVANELEWDPKVDPAHIGIAAKGGAITLTGHVTSYPQKYAALRAAERVYGVKAVADELEVKLPASSKRDDSQIAEAIAHQRTWSSLIPAAVKVEVEDGHVTLHGEVEWSYQRGDAARAVRHLAGVQSVANLIAVKTHAKPKAAEVERRVEDAIERMADLDARSIWVTTSNGTVQLHGHVHSFSKRRIAEHAAEAAPGVTQVENELSVMP